jgi:succinate-acetate transporter protein
MDKLANPAPLGLAGFALTTFVLSMYNAKLLPVGGAGIVVPLAFVYGGLAQMVAGVWEMKAGNTFGYTAFFTYGSFWVAYSLLLTLLGAGLVSIGAGSSASGAVGIFLAMFGIFTFYMWIATFRLNWALFVVFLLLWITFFVLAAGAFGSSASTTQAGGILGLLTAIAAFYTSAAIVINETFGKTAVPLGGAPLKAR